MNGAPRYSIFPFIFLLFSHETWAANKNHLSQIESNGTLLVSQYQLSDGALEWSSTVIEEYFGNLAAIGLTKDPTHLSNVQSWMEWYIAHLNPAGEADYWGLTTGGTIYDYEILSDGTETPQYLYCQQTGKCAPKAADSTDSYAATFLSLARAYYETHDSAAIVYILSVQPSLEEIANTLTDQQLPDGMTKATPLYNLEYLMDNSEVYRGLDDMAYLEKVAFKNSGNAKYYEKHARKVLNGIQKELWDPTTQSYFTYKNAQTGGFHTASWGTFYPDATAELFPLNLGVISASSRRAIQLYADFNTAFSNWDTLPDGRTSPPWALLAEVAALMGDQNRFDTYMSSYPTVFFDSQTQKFFWPWSGNESGWIMRALSK